MHVLVYPHQMIIGGSQINALELAAKVRDRGHRVTIVAPDGPLVQMVEELGLPYHRTKSENENVSVRNTRQLMELARRLNVDLIHAYEWRPAMEASFGPHLLQRLPLVVTVLSMYVSGFIPKHLSLVVGTRELQDMTVSGGRKSVHVVEPPVDTMSYRSQDVAAARRRWAILPHEIVLSVVCRMTHDLQKLEGVLDAIAVVGRLASTEPIRFLVVGGGEGFSEVAREARAVNDRLGREVVIVTGPMSDPRSAYEASDIVLGMGSSILRGMAFSNTVIVQGANGFWQLLDESSVDRFLWQGWYGDGGGGAVDLEDILRRLLADRSQLPKLGLFSRRLVENRFDLERATDQLIAIYQDAIASKGKDGWVSSMGVSVASFAKCEAHIAYQRLASKLAVANRGSR